HRRGHPGGAGGAGRHHAGRAAGVLLPDRQRHVAALARLAGFGQRAGARQGPGAGHRAQLDQLQHRPQLRSGAGGGDRGRRRGAYGVGAVAGALNVARIERLGTPEAVVRCCLILFGAAVMAVGFSHNLILTCLALVAAGGAWMVSVTIFNVSIQTAAPRWVSGRALATLHASTAGCPALGAWAWGMGADHVGTGPVLLAAGAALLASPL